MRRTDDNDMNLVNFLQEHAAANVFTGDEEIFAFQRAVSRLNEMQGSEYWQQWNKKAV